MNRAVYDTLLAERNALYGALEALYTAGHWFVATTDTSPHVSYQSDLWQAAKEALYPEPEPHVRWFHAERNHWTDNDMSRVVGWVKMVQEL